MAACMKFRFIPNNTGGRTGGARSGKQIERKILHVYLDRFLLRVLLCLKALVVIGFTVFALYVQV